MLGKEKRNAAIGWAVKELLMLTAAIESGTKNSPQIFELASIQFEVESVELNPLCEQFESAIRR